MSKKNDSITVVDTLTGEIRDFSWNTPLEMKGVYLQINNEIKALERAKAKVAVRLDEFLGDEDKHDFGDGYELVRVQGSRKRYLPEVVREFLDEDQFDLVLEVNATKLKDLLKRLVEENQLKPGTWQEIESRAEVTPNKPYVKLQKGLIK